MPGWIEDLLFAVGCAVASTLLAALAIVICERAGFVAALAFVALLQIAACYALTTVRPHTRRALDADQSER